MELGRTKLSDIGDFKDVIRNLSILGLKSAHLKTRDSILVMDNNGIILEKPNVERFGCDCNIF